MYLLNTIHFSEHFRCKKRKKEKKRNTHTHTHTRTHTHTHTHTHTDIYIYIYKFRFDDLEAFAHDFHNVKLQRAVAGASNVDWVILFCTNGQTSNIVIILVLTV